jgi:hypothetical protein
MRVFICSTCYDLIDTRAELEAFLREAGVEPVLSDSLDSEFQVLPDRNSIETCLANVRNCDQFIMILSNRYGPSLKKAGFEDISATHLEYQTAIKQQMPVHVFVRDRLEGDYATWKANKKKPNLQLPWCEGKHNRRVFELLEEHRKLVGESRKNNWLYVFRDSTEIKRHLTKLFKEAFARSVAAKVAANGRVPFFEISATYIGYNPHNHLVAFDMRIKNLGGGFAVTPKLQILQTMNSWLLPSLGERDQTNLMIEWAVNNSPLELQTRLDFSILDGHKFADLGKITIHHDAGNVKRNSLKYELKKRSYEGANLEMLIT